MNPEEKVQVALHEERIKNLDVNVDKIMNNHLPHIQEAVDKLDRKIAYWSGGVGVLVVIAQHLLK